MFSSLILAPDVGSFWVWTWLPLVDVAEMARRKAAESHISSFPSLASQQLLIRTSPKSEIRQSIRIPPFPWIHSPIVGQKANCFALSEVVYVCVNLTLSNNHVCLTNKFQISFRSRQCRNCHIRCFKTLQHHDQWKFSAAHAHTLTTPTTNKQTVY